ncbi:MAG TPA: hypothetical protein VFW47_05420, partial [Phenylobacterium sp.]|nr:hypothetical protein [Phenylobacterium sp.]
MRGYWIGMASLGALAAGLAGCGTTSVVNSTSVVNDTGGAAGKAGPAYLTYYLPQTVLAVKFAARKSGGGDEDKPGSASATATVSNSITIDGKAAKVDAKPDAAGGGEPKPKPKAVCDQAMERYNLLQAAHAAYTLKRVGDLEALRTRARGPLATAAQQAAADKALADFVEEAALDDSRVTAAAPLANHVLAVCTFQTEVTPTAEVAPDLIQAYRLRAPDDSLSADSFTLKIAENGLLTSVSTVADDKTAEAAAGAFKSIGTIVGITYSGGVSPVPQGLVLTKAPAPEAYGYRRLKPKRPSEAEYRRRFLAEVARFASKPVAELPILAP